MAHDLIQTTTEIKSIKVVDAEIMHFNKVIQFDEEEFTG